METDGVQRPTLGISSVSEGRSPWLNPFEAKRKEAPIGAYGRILYLNVAEEEVLETNRLGGEKRSAL